MEMRGPHDGDPPCWQIFIQGDDRMVNQHYSFQAAVQWAHSPQLHKDGNDPFWFFTANERGERSMFRLERAKEISRHIVEQAKKKND
jgi:hypothetical protein